MKVGNSILLAVGLATLVVSVATVSDNESDCDAALLHSSLDSPGDSGTRVVAVSSRRQKSDDDEGEEGQESSSSDDEEGQKGTDLPARQKNKIVVVKRTRLTPKASRARTFARRAVKGGIVLGGLAALAYYALPSSAIEAAGAYLADMLSNGLCFCKPVVMPPIPSPAEIDQQMLESLTRILQNTLNDPTITSETILAGIQELAKKALLRPIEIVAECVGQCVAAGAAGAEAAVEAVTDAVVETVAGTVAESVTGAVAETVTDAVAETVAETVTEAVVEAAVQAVADTTANTVATSAMGVAEMLPNVV